jgi:hypothetical protein
VRAADTSQHTGGEAQCVTYSIIRNDRREKGIYVDEWMKRKRRIGYSVVE